MTENVRYKEVFVISSFSMKIRKKKRANEAKGQLEVYLAHNTFISWQKRGRRRSNRALKIRRHRCDIGHFPPAPRPQSWVGMAQSPVKEY